MKGLEAILLLIPDYKTFPHRHPHLHTDQGKSILDSNRLNDLGPHFHTPQTQSANTAGIET